MNIIALIPARYDASRFPGKLMKQLGNQSVILATYQATIDTKLFNDVYVVTDSTIIYDEIVNNGGKAMMSIEEHACGTDRIAEAAQQLNDADIIINVQGDEPFTNKSALAAIIDVFEKDTEQQIPAVSIMHPLVNEADIKNPNNVKVVTDLKQNAVLFSRSVIPYHRDTNITASYFKHIGIYAFRRVLLLEFPFLTPGPLELLEKLEGNRFVEHAIPLKMVVSDMQVIGIDTPEDLQKAQAYLNNI